MAETGKRPFNSELKFKLVVLKGIIEKDDGAAYFGSLIGYPMWVEEARAIGLIEKSRGMLIATSLGLAVYHLGLDLLPKRGRAVNWTWPPSLIDNARMAIEGSSLIDTDAIKISGKLNLCD
jgi:hypothetical protein